MINREMISSDIDALVDMLYELQGVVNENISSRKIKKALKDSDEIFFGVYNNCLELLKEFKGGSK
jgi:hypothetical protein